MRVAFARRKLFCNRSQLFQDSRLRLVKEQAEDKAETPRFIGVRAGRAREEHTYPHQPPVFVPYRKLRQKSDRLMSFLSEFIH